MKLLDDSCTLSTKRLLLRPLRPDDAAPLFALFNNWNVVRFLSSPPWPYTANDAEWFVSQVIACSPELNEDVLAITKDGRFIGMIGVRLRKANALQRGPGPNIGYWIGEPFWGHGYMSETLGAFAQHLFKITDAETLYSGAFTENAASLRVQEKVGFVRDGETMLFSKPRGGDFPHVNTALPRTGFQAGGMAGGASAAANLRSRRKI
ncbi:GNAT family N-acetyltransferase [Bradyrhizobium sp. LHD-71]|uniref:GNAT family N-acetyltransferase n=1 Tax=Bradyrhizobium sp. LHD-71 TaxID=3072141 RepID=UPI00280E5F08|nr:GNAT family N-acetyltransferase [Bradyrhizobium sp. LHD-71]MDQ8732041.1 GNAT family N-acetyltransferase [Bradyrhizobium sp. LHD-71]